MTKLKRVLDGIVDTRRHHVYEAAQRVLNRIPMERARALQFEWLMVPFPKYAYGMQKAAALASALDLPGFTAIEFGVAGGNGLVAMEQHAARLSSDLGLSIDVVGFDLAIGMPPATGYKDLTYRWSEGDFAMDEQALRNRLSTAQLILGDVSDTVPDYRPYSPIGFISFDLDYYSSTLAALQVVEGRHWDNWLPRINAYFDDLRTIEWVGERQAITEWNARHDDRKVGQVKGIRDSVFSGPAWAEKMFEIHLFEHPVYGKEIGSADWVGSFAERARSKPTLRLRPVPEDSFRAQQLSRARVRAGLQTPLRSEEPF